MEKDKKRKRQTAEEVWKENAWFFTVLLFFDCFCFLCLWLLDNRKSEKLAAIFILFTGVIFVFFFLDKMKKKNKKFLYFRELFSDRNNLSEELNTEILSFEEKWIIEKLREKIEDMETEKKDMGVALQQQREYVETWVHEVKTPISWLTLMLENREDEMSPKVYQRLQYMNVQLQEYVAQILYFSRLSYDHKREIMEWVNLPECIDYVLEAYEYLLTENRISIVQNLKIKEIFTDRKNLEFILSQAVSNSIQYRKEEKGQIVFSAYEKEENLCLSIEDNGKGVSEADLPFVFEKGFAGSNGQENKKSTGIGLYLVKKLTENMKLACSAENTEAGGFRLVIEFPKVEKEELV